MLTSGPGPAPALEQLPRELLLMVLAQSGMPCMRRVCKAARDVFDAVNTR